MHKGMSHGLFYDSSTDPLFCSTIKGGTLQHGTIQQKGAIWFKGVAGKEVKPKFTVCIHLNVGDNTVKHHHNLIKTEDAPLAWICHNKLLL